jgi:hypothetical protein
MQSFDAKGGERKYSARSGNSSFRLFKDTQRRTTPNAPVMNEGGDRMVGHNRSSLEKALQNRAAVKPV